MLVVPGGGPNAIPRMQAFKLAGNVANLTHAVDEMAAALRIMFMSVPRFSH